MAKMDMFHSEIIGNNMRKLKKFAKASARLAVKASPIPIPEELTNMIGIQENKMDLIEERLDFIDKNHLNTKLENLRVLCLNCIYELQTTMKGWYRHRDVPLVSVIDDHLPRDIHIESDENVNIQETLKVPLEVEVKEELEVDYIPFEEFQKTLE